MFAKVGIISTLYLVGGRRNVATSASPVDVDVLALRVLLVSIFRLDPKCVGTKIISLGLQKIGR